VEILSRAIDSFFNGNIDTANPAIDEARELVVVGEELFPHLRGKGGTGTMSRTAVMDSLLRTIMYSTDIAEIAINDAMRNAMVNVD